MAAPDTATQSPIFVVGTGRSGTTLLRMMLCAHPRIYLTHEASFYVWEAVFPWKKKGPAAFVPFFLQSFSFCWLRLDPRPIIAALPNPITRDDIPGFYAAIMREKAAAYGKPRFGDKTPSHSGSLGRIFRDFPDAKVVRIVRDPRGVVKSLGRMPWASRSLIAASMLCEVERKQVLPFRDRILEIRLEDLLQDPRSTMGRVLDYVGEDWSDQVLEHTRHLPSPNDLPPVPWFDSAAQERGAPAANWEEFGPREVRLVEWLNRRGLASQGYARKALEREPSRLSVFWRYLCDQPELYRFLYYFARVAWASRRPEDGNSPEVRALFRKLNPRAWSLYPGLVMPDPPALPEGWDLALPVNGPPPWKALPPMRPGT